MADLLIQQQGVGSVLKQTIEDDDDDDELVDTADVYGITTVLNLYSHKVRTFIFLRECIEAQNLGGYVLLN